MRRNIIILFLIFFPLFVFSLKCDDIDNICQNVSDEECLKRLKECESFFEEKIKILEGKIGKTEAQKRSLANEIYYLKQKIKKLNWEIQQTSLMIKETSLQISETEKSIEKTKEKINLEKQRLVEILRAIDEAERKSLIEILVSEESLSSFFNNLIYLENLNKKSSQVLSMIKNLKKALEEQRNALEGEKENAEKLLQIQVLQKKENEQIKKEKNYLLGLTEAQYESYLKEKKVTQEKVAEIRKRIFELVGVPKEQAPTFEEAYQIAKYVESKTGVRPAFLLAILTQESNLGKNVGQCYLRNTKTGSGIKILTGRKVERVMAPGPPYSRRNDVYYFLQITKELGKDWRNTPVSCPLGFGWGGAMGPAQFIPTTWMQYKERISKITGRPANPWNITDAFLAAGLYLADYGAAKQTPEAEWRAALIYFTGTTNPRYSWYAKSVFAIMRQYEQEIKLLEKTLAKMFFQGRNYFF